MKFTKRKIISGSGVQNLPRLSSANDVAVVEVSRSGVVLDINELGKRLLGWKKNDRLAAPIASALKTLPEGPPMRLPIGGGGVYVVGVSKGNDRPCVLFGFELNRETASSNAPFEQIVDRMPVAITRTDWHGVVSFANRYARKFLGKDPVGSTVWRDIILENDHWKLDEAFLSLARDGYATTRVRYLDSSGQQRTALLYLHTADEGEYIDIAGMDSSDEHLHVHFSGDAPYKTIVEQSPVGIVHLNTDGIIVMENHPFRQITGESPEDAWIGRHYTAVADIDSDFADTIAAMLQDGKPFLMEDVDYASPNGEYVLTLRGTPIISEDGEISGGVVIVEDRTSQKRAEEIIERTKDEAVESAARKAAFINTMSHELRTPLGAIRGYSDLLLEEVEDLKAKGDVPDVLAEFAQTIRERSQGVLTLVDNLFDMALMDSGMIAMDCAPLDLRKTIEKVAASEMNRFSQKGVNLVVDLDDPEYLMDGDEHRIEQVLRILVDNALKFTPEGSVTIRAALTDQAATIDVIDTGIGIDEEYIDSLFRPMVQGDDRLNREFDGAGIGLAMVDRVVKQMGGTITVRNRPDEGSVFSLQLPVAC